MPRIKIIRGRRWAMDLAGFPVAFFCTVSKRFVFLMNEPVGLFFALRFVVFAHRVSEAFNCRTQVAAQVPHTTCPENHDHDGEHNQ